jgi:hypothetical protein
VTTDQAFTRASRLLDKASRIWITSDITKYSEAEMAYQEAVRIRDEYFPNKNVLTGDSYMIESHQ